MIDITRARLGIAAALLFIVLGTAAACADVPTAPTESTQSEECIWVGPVLHCRRGA
jgi:hypothetical protein